ncbi:PREDICTED: neurotrypsin-like, partial [Amphimedon queenslandica]|uniref:SRCR domain-containing protein n=1 Tax=Amphimedon queenslandica TaxID=400682 RepID=A0AAN0K0K3_AMPQE
MSAMLSHIYLLLFTSLLLTNRDTVQGQYDGALRLWRNGQTSLAYTFGRVQVYLKGQCGNVCWNSNADSVFTKQEADVTCRNLGYIGSSYYSTSSNDNYGVDPSPTLMYRVHCPSTDNRLLLMSCSHDTDTISSHCTDANDVGVLCYSSRIWFDPYPGMVRLSGGDYINEGLVEVYYNGVWGKVCNLLSHDANTICKQLGYTSSPLNATVVGLPSQVHWYNSLQCSSLSDCVHECSSLPTIPATCFHSAYIHCEYSAGNSINNLYSCDT